MTNAIQPPNANESRVIECPFCAGAMTAMEAGGVTVDVCVGGCGGMWFDRAELRRVDEARESAGEELLDIQRDPARRPDLRKRAFCPIDGEIMMRHFHSVKRAVVVDECPKCAGFCLNFGELAFIRNEYATEEDRKKAAQEYFSELFDSDLAAAHAKTAEESEKAQRIARAFRFICPSYYIPGKQDWGAF